MPLTVAIADAPDRARALTEIVRALGMTVVDPSAAHDVYIGAGPAPAAPVERVALLGPLPPAAVRACLVELSDAVAPPAVLHFTHARIDLDRGRLIAAGRMRPLRDKEVELLRALARRAGRAVPRAHLLGEVWGYGPGVRTRTLDTTVARLRRLIEPDRRRPVHLLTAHGVGYRLDPLPPGLLGAGAMVEQVLVGRVAEQDALSARFAAGHRWVALVGLGGIGKSALARCWARRTATTRPGGTWWVDLAGGTGIDDLLSAVASALDVSLLPAHDAVTRLGAIFARRPPTLLVLDGCEHATPALVAVLPRWLAAAESLQVLTTSRRPGGATDETPLPIGALPADDARALLERTWTAHDRPAPASAVLDRLVAACGGVPLALELAADIAARGEAGSLDVAEGEAPARLDAVIGAAWRDLSPEQRMRLTRLSAFAGPVGLDAALGVEAVPGVSLLDRLQSLHDRGLLALADPLGRRFVVPEPVRRFALHQGGAPDARRRHRAWCLEVCARQLGAVDGPDGEATLDRLARLRIELTAIEHRADEASTGLRAALAWAVLTLRRGPWSHLDDRIERALEAWPDAAPRLTARLLQIRVIARLVRGDISAAMVDVTGARAVLDGAAPEDGPVDGLRLPSVDIRALVDGCEAQTWARIDPTGALDVIERMLAGPPTPLVRGLALWARGIARGGRMRWMDGAADLGEAATWLRQAGRHRHTLVAECDRIHYLAEAGHPADAIAVADRLDAVAPRVQGPVLTGFITKNRALALLDSGRLDDAGAAFEQAAELFDDAALAAHRRTCLIGSGDAALLAGDLPRADALFAEALVAPDRHRGRALAGRALVAARRRDLDGARRHGQAARAAGGFPAHVRHGVEQLVAAAERLLDPAAPAPDPVGLDGRLASRLVADGVTPTGSPE